MTVNSEEGIINVTDSFYLDNDGHLLHRKCC